LSETVNIRTYISDMIAVEQHILLPITKQLSEEKVQALPHVLSVLQKTERVLTKHIDVLKAHLEVLGGHPAASLKTAVADLLGAGASAVQDFRKTKVSKSLRDDQTALSLASVAYEMLYTTSLVSRSNETAKIAIDNLKDIVSIIMELTGVVSDVVSMELIELDPTLDGTVAEKAKDDIYGTWSSHPVASV
jgi:hypothetical protein